MYRQRIDNIVSKRITQGAAARAVIEILPAHQIMTAPSRLQ
jgi:hypothetical protein